MARKTRSDQLNAEFRRQWVAVKQQYPDMCVLVSGVGSLTYYTFDEDAERIRGEAHVRAVGENVVALAREYAEPIITALVATGQRVAIAEPQVQP